MAHWRDNMRPARFFMFDARAGFTIALLLVHFRLYTLYFVVFCFVLFWLLERLGLTFEAALRKGRAWLCGNHRPAVIGTARRHLIDLGQDPND